MEFKTVPRRAGRKDATPGSPQRETHAGEGEDEKKLHDAPPSGAASGGEADSAVGPQ